MNNKTWEERFETKCVKHWYTKKDGTRTPSGTVAVKKLKAFISSLLVEEVKRVMEKVDVEDLGQNCNEYGCDGSFNCLDSANKSWRAKKLQVLTDYENEMKK